MLVPVPNMPGMDMPADLPVLIYLKAYLSGTFKPSAEAHFLLAEQVERHLDLL